MLFTKEFLADHTNPAQYLFMALSARGPVHLLVDTGDAKYFGTKLPDHALEQSCVTVEFHDAGDQILGQKAITGWATIDGEEHRVQVPWNAVTYMLSPTDSVWVSWERERPTFKLNLGVIDGDGESATKAPSERPKLKIAEG